MAERIDWSREEVEACVADYLRMLTLELNGQRYNKTVHANALMKFLNGRNRASVEFKHANVSAVMIALGYPYIDGYKPRGNYQAMLVDAVEAQLLANDELQASVQAAVLRPATAAAVADLANVWVPTPKPARVKEAPAGYAPNFSPAKRDYLAQEARNRSLGRAGELFIAELESRRLHAAGKKVLANRVEHVAATQGDGLGFDVLSFENSGRERLIEVKTTTFGQLTPFYVSRNELARSKADAEIYRLYRVFDFRDRPRLFDLPGAISASCNLEAASYLARVAG
ncbi:DUF3883 domain-containing protein [Luteimonas sp. 22616]|uniref:DUF3883 domain-containing protein n=1 Tax=Luteimonas sp. 22616 TaxID=3453951 RepID=UPI003F858F0D